MADVRWNGPLVDRAIRQAAFRALHTGAEHILSKAIDQAPLDKGPLRRSGTVTDNEQEGEVSISFNTPYARRQHEELTWRHTDGKAKYLEDPFNEHKALVIRRVRAEIERALR